MLLTSTNPALIRTIEIAIAGKKHSVVRQRESLLEVELSDDETKKEAFNAIIRHCNEAQIARDQIMISDDNCISLFTELDDIVSQGKPLIANLKNEIFA